MHNDYYEGILQLRDIEQDVLDFVFSQFEKNKISIAKIVELKSGCDIYSSSNKFSRKIAKKLFKEYGGELKESPQLFSRSEQEGRNIYRLNVLYKASKYRKGEIVINNNNIYKITSIEKETISGTNIITGKKRKFRECEKLEIYLTEVVSTKPKTHILDRESYELVPVENSKNEIEGEQINVVNYKNRVYIV